MQKILLTGGAGFIGTHLAERLCDRYEVVLFDNLRRDSLRHAPQLIANTKVAKITGDVLDASAVDRACQGVDTVLHLAAIAGVSSYEKESLTTLRVNVQGTINVLESAAKHGVQRFVDFSTSETFGPDAMWVSETSPHAIGPASEKRWVYAASKVIGEHFTLRFGEVHNFISSIVKPFNIYGPRQMGEGAIGNFCRNAIGGRKLLVEGDGASLRAWCYISDFVDAVEAILHAPEEKVRGQVFNIGNPREVATTLGLARAVCELWNGAEIEFRPAPPTEVRARIPNIEKARKLLGFEPKVDLKQGLGHTLKFFKNQGDKS